MKRVGIENHDIGPHAGFDHAPVGQPQARGGQRAEFPDGVRQRKCAVFADVLAQDVRKCPISARVRMLLAEQAVGRRALRIVAHADPRLLQRQPHVRLGHAEHSNLSGGVVFDQEIEDGIEGVFIPELRDFGDGLALQRQQLGILHDADQDALPDPESRPTRCPRWCSASASLCECGRAWRDPSGVR